MKIENAKKHIYSYDENNLIYEGQSSKVYTAIDEALNMKVCLKIIPYSGASPIAAATIQKEAIGLAKAGSNSTHVPVLLDFWQDKRLNLFYLVMQYIPGSSMKTLITSTDKRTFLNWMISLCDTLDRIHRAHVYHKDIKPENIIITPSNDVYLIDFNISIGTPNLREGTVCYRAPEMHSPGITVARNQSDIFSIGVILYEYFTGRAPVEGETYGNDMFSASSKEWSYFTVPSEVNPSISKLLSDIIQKCMKKNPDLRYRQASDLKRDLIQALKEMRK